MAREIQGAAGCEHDVAPEGSPVLTGVACSPQRADLALAEIKTIDSALTASPGVTQTAVSPDRLAPPERYRHYQPASGSSQAVLRI